MGLTTHSRTTHSPTSAAGTPRRAGAVRLALIEPAAPRTTLDGAWWPRTADLDGELGPLLEELQRRGVRATRVAFNPASWAPTGRRLRTGDRTVRLGWFGRLDPHLVSLTGDLGRARVDLLVVPPGTPRATADRAFAAATDHGNRAEPTALLRSLDTPVHGRPEPAP
ncbi:DUF5994 family protein [Geodermatophilus sp. SYSU D01119]